MDQICISTWSGAVCHLALSQALECVLSRMKVKAKAAKGNETKKQNKAAFIVFHGPLNFTKLTSIHFGLVLVLQLQELLSLFWFREGHKTATSDSNPFSPAFKSYAASVIPQK